MRRATLGFVLFLRRLIPHSTRTVSVTFNTSGRNFHFADTRRLGTFIGCSATRAGSRPANVRPQNRFRAGAARPSFARITRC
ncbi:protein of unknown function [Cupriavidus taiwanensis]|uniref:Uncharacterized protein n=1 Tax=Cupriavidus taiwanensis TaxID=164546 RepID=A0A375IEZ8_9BURK|nr:protein of unknown function [Cupriavidus taiwanensis]